MEIFDLVIFFTLIPLLLYVDLRLFNKGADNVIGFRRSLILSLWYIVAALLFGLIVQWHLGTEHAMHYYTIYILEKSLSLDNLFVMSIIFSSFSIPRKYQHRVLIWGIIGVIILRGLMIIGGAAIVHEFEWVLFIFAFILIYTGIKMLFMNNGNDVEDLDKKPLVIFLKKHLPFTSKIHGHSFFVRRDTLEEEERKSIKGSSKFIFTPLLLALVVIEVSDVIFAVDSIPAALAISTDAFIVFTSNIFAVLGLRALFFAVENIIDRFMLMKYSLAFVLSFIGFKVFYNGIFTESHITPALSLIITISALTAGFVFSWIKTSKENRDKKISGA